MSLRNEPHFTIAPSELAAWLEKQGTDRWWNVDGDPLLTGKLSIPCPADELADELRRVNRTLLVQDRRKQPTGHGERITARDLDQLVSRLGDNVQAAEAAPWTNDRLFFLCWEDQNDDWLLCEDVETTERSRADAALTQGTGK